jgi:hypothetical protein
MTEFMTRIRDRRLSMLLTYAGTLPLVIAAAGLIVGRLDPNLVVVVASTYSAMIVAFLAGIHWACYLFFAERCSYNLLITSNIVALLAWLSLLIPHQQFLLGLQILCFLFVLLLDDKLRRADILPSWFYALRRNATVIVVVSLFIMMSQI